LSANATWSRTPAQRRSYDQLITLNPGVVNYTSQRAAALALQLVVGNMFAASGRARRKSLPSDGVEFTSASEINNTPAASAANSSS